MRYHFLVALLVAFTSGNALAFDFHGVKSGMSKEQVSSALNRLGISDSSSYVDVGDDGISGVKPSPRFLSFGYDHQGKLYQMNIDYLFIKKDLTGPQTEAFKEVLEEK